MLARVALVEDNEELRDDILAPGLTMYGFDITCYGTAGAFYDRPRNASFDLLVVDITLPDDSGLKLIHRYREEDRSTGVLALSTLPIDRAGASAFQLGADMYLTKPVTIVLLASALHALLRRIWGADKTQTHESVRSDEHGSWYVTGPQGEFIAFTATERLLLQRLRDAGGTPVDKEALIDAIAHDPVEFDHHRLEVIVHRLRRKLASAADAGLDIVTVRGVGYALVMASAP